MSLQRALRVVASLLVVGLLTQPAAAQDRVGRPPVQTQMAPSGMVVCETATAAEIGVAALERGGSAADAAVAVGFALAVIWPEAGNIGGGGFMLVAPPGEPVISLDYREVAPQASTVDMYAPGDSTLHPKAVGVPGTVRGLAAAHERFGRLPWRELVMPAVALAEEGFTVDEHLAASMNWVLSRPIVREDEEGRFAELRRVYGHPDGRPWRAGDTLVLPDLADTLRHIAGDGPDAFYTGPIAEDLAAEMAAGGGLITVEDLAAYQPRWREPGHAAFHGYDVYVMPLPSSGGVAVPQILGLFDALDGLTHPRWSPEALHLLVESMRRAFRDRAKHLGDPDFTQIPDFLLKPAHLRELASTVDLEQATPSEAIAGDIAIAEESPDTTHFSIVDGDGMAVSNTYTLEASWGSRVMVSGRGFLLNNEMGDFNWFPGHTDRTGRIGTEPNRIAPGKRMLSSMSPTIVRRDGDNVLVVGSPGGRSIINTVVQVLLNRLAYDMPLPDAVQAPRLHHQWLPDRVQVEPAFAQRYPWLVEALAERGHRVEVTEEAQGSAHCIEVLPDGSRLGVADYRRGGAARGY